MTEPTIIDLLDGMAERRRVAVEAYRRRAAELEVLEAYDEIRHAKGHDYGGAQRDRELRRRRAELEDLAAVARYTVPGREPADVTVTAGDLEAALERIATPRMARVDDERSRRATAATRRTRLAWDELVRRIDGRVVNRRAGLR